MLILIRHGQSTSNAAGLLAGRSEMDLTDAGREQARSLAPSLTSVREARSSSLGRARETAALALPHVTATVDDAFIEQDYGSYDGRPAKEVSDDEWSSFRASHDGALGGGESLAAVDRRVHEALQKILDDPDSLIYSEKESVAIVSHVSPIKSAVAWALSVPGATVWRMRLDNASLTVIGARASGPYLVTFNDTSARKSASRGSE